MVHDVYVVLTLRSFIKQLMVLYMYSVGAQCRYHSQEICWYGETACASTFSKLLNVCQQSFNPFPTLFLTLGFLQSIMKGLQSDAPDVVHTVLSTLQGRVSKITAYPWLGKSF